MAVGGDADAFSRLCKCADHARPDMRLSRAWRSLNREDAVEVRREPNSGGKARLICTL